MKLRVSSSPHQRITRDTGAVMRLVMYAAIPGLLAQAWFFGWGVLIQLVLAITICVASEALILTVRKKPVYFALTDYSAVLTGWLIAVSIPPLLPWWMTFIGCAFAIIVAKQLYGGLGFNLFNPAMVGYVVLLISFPAAMTQWTPTTSQNMIQPDFADALHIIFTGFTVSGHDIEQLRFTVDGTTSATPLDYVKTALTQGNTYSESLAHSTFSGGFFDAAGAGWGWVSLAYLAGGLVLLQQRVISWHIPMSLLGGVFVTSLILHMTNGDIFGSPLFHLLNGAVMIGAFFIATDPVSASTTPKGRIIFGAAIGFWVVIIRVFGGYPDALAFSVLILNMAVPLIDYYTQPRTYGHRAKRQSVEQK
ncbi:electron transport complex subunit RsxD [Alteromonas sediminis]|uniref:Ion-translocating oxidoreductase complex subunit D n=1 Tax=Alteromonas sediminis TaxID=2259342 RepID=A0A3N5YFJ1_9ALTE|nr:electron transport complex subunit RsxD [Alteromonas sediminis]RPJ68835.1 electron transport complex subunit RsxD [Alteromonas sediminis]